MGGTRGTKTSHSMGLCTKEKWPPPRLTGRRGGPLTNLSGRTDDLMLVTVLRPILLFLGWGLAPGEEGKGLDPPSVPCDQGCWDTDDTCLGVTRTVTREVAGCEGTLPRELGMCRCQSRDVHHP